MTTDGVGQERSSQSSIQLSDFIVRIDNPNKIDALVDTFDPHLLAIRNLAILENPVAPEMVFDQ